MTVLASSNIRRYNDIEELLDITVSMKLYAEDTLYVYYGLQGLSAVQNVDYEIVLAEDDYSTFVFRPFESLINKINALIVIDPDEENTVLLVRTLPLATAATPASARSSEFAAKEFDRIWLALQQLEGNFARVLSVPVGQSDQYDLDLPPYAASELWGWAPDSQRVVTYNVGIDGVITGDSAYEVAVANGYTGTVEEWLQSLISPQYSTYVLVAGTTMDDAPLFIRTNGYTTVGDGGGALYRKTSPNTEPSHAGKFSVTVAGIPIWYELVEKVVTLEMFGGKPDAVYSGTSPSFTLTSGTDNVQPMVNALTYLEATGGGNSKGGVLQLLGGEHMYYMSQSININAKHTIQGRMGAGTAGSPAGSAWGHSAEQSALLFAADTVGLYINSGATRDGAAATPSPAISAAGCLLRNFSIYSLGGTDRTKHGIVPKVRFVSEDINITNFPGSGFYIDSNSPTGNINYARITRGRIYRCQNGIYCKGGSDANGLNIHDVEANTNRGAGFRDNSFLGNDYWGCGADGNGELSVVEYAGNLYYVINEALAATTQPGTNAAVWGFWKAGTLPARVWTMSTTLELIRGGAMIAENNNSRTTFWGGYLGEPNQPPSVIDFKNATVGGYRATFGQVVGSGNIQNTDSLVGSKGLSARYVEGRDGITGQGPLGYLVNTGSRNTTRGAWLEVRAGLRADAVTERFAGAFGAQSISTDATIGTAAFVDVLASGDEVNHYRIGIFDGSLKAIYPSVNVEVSLGLTTRRFLAGFIDKLHFGGDSNRFDTTGTGSPEGVVTARIGSTYRRTDGGANTTWYVKESGTGNTGWVAK